MKKVLFGITNLEIGGAEKVLVNIVNELKDTYDITILTLYAQGCLEKDISKDVKLESVCNKSYEQLGFIKRKFFSLQLKMPFFRKRLYKKYVAKKYDVEVAFLEGPITELLQEKSKAKKVAWIHTDLEKHYHERKHNKLIEVYKKYQHLVFVSQNSLDKFNLIDSSNTFLGKKEIIYNYISFDSIIRLSKGKIDDKFSKEINFVVVARLVSAKGIDRLMKVHKKLMDDKLNHHIYVVGDGPLKQELIKLQREYKVENTFHLLGQKTNPYPYIKKGDYFLLPSYYEGYPVTLIEAMALNKFIVATNIASCEVLKDYSSKLIAENSEEGIYNSLKQIITSPNTKNNKNKFNNPNNDILDKINKLIGGEE
ncbi:MAG: glycosyltransferase [Bacilli bacterium]|nr:glycosyltransferase [Bacilli bacterium]